MRGSPRGTRARKATGVLGKAYPLFSVSRDCQMIFTSLWTSHSAGKRTPVRAGKECIPGIQSVTFTQVIKLGLFLSQSIWG